MSYQKIKEIVQSDYLSGEKMTKIITLVVDENLGDELIFKVIDDELSQSNNQHNLDLIDLKLLIYGARKSTDESFNYIKLLDDVFLNDNNYDEYLAVKTKHEISYYYRLLAEKKKAIQIGDEVINKLKSNSSENVQLRLINLYIEIGGFASNSGDFKKFIKYFENAIDICEKLKADILLASIYLFLGKAYSNQKEKKTAFKYLEFGLSLSEEVGNLGLQARSLTQLGMVSFKLGDSSKAQTYFDKVLVILNSHKDYNVSVYCLSFISLFYIETNKLNDFFGLMPKLQEAAKYDNYIGVQSRISQLLGEAYFKTKEYDKALLFATKYEEIEIERKGFINLSQAYGLKLNIYEALEDYKMAFQYFDKFFEINNRIVTDKSKKAVNEFEAKYQNERKEKEIQALKLESVSFQLQFLKSQMNPHFIFNTIGSISADLKANNIDKSKQLLYNFSSLMRSTLDFAEVERISLEEEINFLNNYLTLEKYRLEDNMHFEIHYDDDLDIDFIDVPSMIIQPYIENAIKHGIKPLTKKGIITIEFLEKQDHLVCTIIDNGIGRKVALENSKKYQKHIGKSTTINAKRLSLIKSKDQDSINVKYTDLFDEKENSLGTKVELIIKL